MALCRASLVILFVGVLLLNLMAVSPNQYPLKYGYRWSSF